MPGHLSLIERARERCDPVVVSLFVNPAQFDRARGPRGLSPREAARRRSRRRGRRRSALRSAGRRRSTRRDLPRRVEVRGLSEPLEGTRRGARALPRRHHGRDEAAVHGPARIAYFGQKDAQQVARDPPPRARPEPAGRDRDLPDGPRGRRPRDVEPQRAASGDSASARGAARRPGRGAQLSPQASAAPIAAGERAQRVARGVEPSTASSWTAERSSRASLGTSRACDRRPRRSSAIDNAVLGAGAAPRSARPR